MKTQKSNSKHAFSGSHFLGRTTKKDAMVATNIDMEKNKYQVDMGDGIVDHGNQIKIGGFQNMMMAMWDNMAFRFIMFIGGFMAMMRNKRRKMPNSYKMNMDNIKV